MLHYRTTQLRLERCPVIIKAQILFDKSSMTSSCTPVQVLEVSLGHPA